VNALHLWIVGSALAMVFTYAVLFDAFMSWRWAKRDGDPDLIREGWRCVRNQFIASITQTVMVALGVMAYIQLHTEWIIYGLVLIPWTINIRIFLDFIDRKRFFHWKLSQKEKKR